MTHASSDTDAMNLTLHRQHESIWDRRGWNGTDDRVAATRVLVGIGGGILAFQGLRRRGWTGNLLLSIGGSLAWWAISGGGRIGQAQHWAGEFAERAGLRSPDPVQEASDESFPASDAPSWTPTVASGANRTAR